MPKVRRVRVIDAWHPLCPSRNLTILKGDDPDEVRFRKHLTGVCALYSQCLLECPPVTGFSWFIRVLPVKDPGEVGIAETENGPDEWTRVQLDSDLFALPNDETRALAYLDWLQAPLLQLAEARGWDATGFRHAYDLCVARGGLLRWSGRAKSSPNRQFKATPHFYFDANGDAWATLTVRDREGTIVAEGGPWDAWPELPAMREAANTMRWTSSSSVEIASFDSVVAEPWGLEPTHTLTIA